MPTKGREHRSRPCSLSARDRPASREAHTRLFINGTYAGVYTIVEAVDKDFLKRTLGENDGYLYKYDYPGEAKPYYFEDRGSNPASRSLT